MRVDLNLFEVCINGSFFFSLRRFDPSQTTLPGAACFILEVEAFQMRNKRIPRSKIAYVVICSLWPRQNR